ncbi:protein of unknown function [Methylocella tundrae]|uniref:Uncharacterized protein n=1 Tax=Methylocella tundrae TaxID=227605 RepID=A0A4U8Z2M3_METTU|nr:protein of unknown function [Methylocella tundrae]
MALQALRKAHGHTNSRTPAETQLMRMCVKSPPIMHNAGRGRGKIFVFERLIWLALAVQTAAARPVSVSAPLLGAGAGAFGGSAGLGRPL